MRTDSLEIGKREPQKVTMCRRILVYRIVLIFLAVWLGLELLILAIGAIGGTEAVAKLPVYILKVQSDSMYPTLKSGDCIFCGDVAFSRIKEGDIINYSFTGDLITHQVIAVNENGTVTTQGIANTYSDGEISESYYAGKVLWKMPFLSVFLDMTASPLQKTIFIAIVLLLFMGEPVMKAVSAHRRETRQTKDAAEQTDPLSE